MQYEGDSLTIVYAGPWLGDEHSGVIDSFGAIDVTHTLKDAAGTTFSFALNNYFLPAVYHGIKNWQLDLRAHVVLAYLMPTENQQVKFRVVMANAPVSFPNEIVPAREDLADTVHRIGGPDWMERLKELKDAMRARLEPGDILALRMGNEHTPNQLRELRDALQHWVDDWVQGVHVLVTPGEALSIIQPVKDDDEQDEWRRRGKMTRIGGTWVTGWVTEAQARTQAAALHKEQADLARDGLKEAKTAPVEWWNDDERLIEPPAEVA